VLRVGNIDNDRDCLAADFFDFFSGRFQSIGAARKQRDMRAMFSKFLRNRAPNSGRSAGNDNRFDRAIH